MTHDIGTPAFAGERASGVVARPHGSAKLRRPPAVLVRIPRLDDRRRPTAPQPSQTLAESTHSPAQPSTSRAMRADRHRSIDHDLRRVRREIQPQVRHSVRNTVILLLILLAAASLTVWFTQGFNASGPPDIPSTTTGADASPFDSDTADDLTGEHLDALDEALVSSWPSSQAGGGSSAPTLRSWPPLDSGVHPPPDASIGRIGNDHWLPPFDQSQGEAVGGPHEPGNAASPLVPGNPLFGAPLAAGSGLSQHSPTPAFETPSPTVQGSGIEADQGPVATLSPIRPYEPVRR